MDGEDERVIKLQSEDKQEFELNWSAAKLSKLVSDSLEGSEETTIEIPNRYSNCLKKVVEYLCHFENEPMKEIKTPFGGSSFEEIIDQEWYQEFISNDSINQEMLFNLLTAANYMGIEPLLDLACLKITFQLNTMTAEQIQQYLKIRETADTAEACDKPVHRWITETS